MIKFRSTSFKMSPFTVDLEGWLLKTRKAGSNFMVRDCVSVFRNLFMSCKFNCVFTFLAKSTECNLRKNPLSFV